MQGGPHHRDTVLPLSTSTMKTAQNEKSVGNATQHTQTRVKPKRGPQKEARALGPLWAASVPKLRARKPNLGSRLLPLAHCHHCCIHPAARCTHRTTRTHPKQAPHANKHKAGQQRQQQQYHHISVTTPCLLLQLALACMCMPRVDMRVGGAAVGLNLQCDMGGKRHLPHPRAARSHC